MIFTHDVEHSLLVLVEFVNASNKPEASGDARLSTLQDVQAFVRRHRITELAPLTAADLGDLPALRRRMRAVFAAQDEETASRLVNEMLGDARVAPRLTDHDDYGWHVHYFTPGTRLAEHLAIDGAMALAHVVVAGELDRLRVCAAPDCSHVLVDLSRNRSKRYCDSRTCGNRLHVAAYRERQRQAAS